ncbi:hypothetical protein [Streptomyces sp. FH025]|uniref:hypothetical protein n=1 Tax=Streptomyces sp. FH025 TaxID=2815937 RepID=UPI001A9D11E2|nr:hypothetical protein [Streptomyces sp. FH025]MBO1413456.1 hypothetical protein [Streptomyces sp. FH025]
MSLPLPAGHVLVRLHGGAEAVAAAVLDALEVSLPTHTGRGHTLTGNVWEDPPTVRDSRNAPELGPPQVWSQTFDPRSAQVDQEPIVLAEGITADVLGTPDAVYAVVRVLGELFHAEEQGMVRRGPEIELRLRLGPPGPGG